MKKDNRLSEKFDTYSERGWANFEPSDRIEKEKRIHQRVSKALIIKDATTISIRRIFQIAASICLIALAVFLLKPEPTSPYAFLGLERSPDAILSIVPLANERNLEDAHSYSLQLASDYYEKGGFSDAIPYFETYLEQKDIKEEVWLYYGQSLLENDPQKAIEIFNNITSSSLLDQIYLDYADWFMAWAFIKLNDLESAQGKLMSISQSESSCKEDAIKLLRALENGTILPQ